MTKDEEHLRLLSIFNYVLAGLTALTGCFFFIHVIMGILIVSGKLDGGTSHGGNMPSAFGWIFIVMGALFIILFWAQAVFMLILGRFLARRKHPTFCLVAAGIECLYMPLGTALGVFTIIVLMRPSVKAMFGAAPPAVTPIA
jgi:hypothetical protein